ncbi:hypothetical protein QZH41_018266 [Actinostola sp. cb2023]|nr:hypothetical protein QZH41_018266 [Actinostola sp. cb2023]
MQFVGNRVRKIKEHEGVIWRHVSTNIVTTTTPETKAEAKVIKEVFALAVEEANELDQLLSRTNLWRTLRVGVWMRRRVSNGVSWTPGLLDVEVALNSRPLSYVEDDHQLPVLTPNTLLYTQSNVIPELEIHHVEDVPGSQEESKVPSRVKASCVCALDRGEPIWKLGIIEELIIGRDGILRGAKLRVGQGVLERPVQHLYLLELSCDRGPPEAAKRLNADASAFRPQREAAVAARARIQEVLEEDELD